jgi:uncharacterized protein (TIGR02453 family)
MPPAHGPGPRSGPGHDPLLGWSTEMDTVFNGWPEDFQRFFIGLELDNSKRYFEANRRLYEKAVRGPMEALVASLESEFGPGKVFRINRDIRFSADKSPYKTNIAATVGMGGRGGYLSLDARGFTVASGRYELDPGALPRFREAVDRDGPGDQLVAIVGELEALGYQLGGEDLKRVPAGYPKDHPRARLLRHKRLYAWRAFGLQPWLGSAEARDQVLTAWRHSEPLNDWFGAHLD